MVSDKLVSESECPGAIVVEKELTNEAKVVVRKVVGKKRQIGSKKIRTISVQKHKVMNKDSLPNASSKKIKRNGHSTPLPTSHDDFNNCSSVPSVASTEGISSFLFLSSLNFSEVSCLFQILTCLTVS